MNTRLSTQKPASPWLENPWVQLVAGLVGMMMISSTQYAWTLFVPSLTETFKWSLPAVQFAFTLFICVMTYAAPLTGFLLDKFGTRLFFSLAALCIGFGWAMMGFAKSIPVLYCYYGLAGLGASFVYTGGIATALKWFPQRRGLASGVMAAGFGSGAAPFIPLIGFLLSNYGYTPAFMYTGIGFGLVLLVVAQVLRFPTEVQTPAAGKAANPPTGHGEGFSPIDMLKRPQFYLLYLTFVGMASGYLLVTAQIKPFSKEYGIASSIVVLAITLNSIANGMGRVIWGAISDKLGRERSMVIDFLVCAIAVALLPALGHDPVMFMVLTFIAMFTFGPIFAFFPPITADRFGTKYLATNYGLLYSAKGAGGLVGGWISSFVILSLGWSFTFYGAAALGVLAAVGALILMKIPKPEVKPAAALVKSA
jgi:OFA family oxalate/formate antiporter-like MFS transporter